MTAGNSLIRPFRSSQYQRFQACFFRLRKKDCQFIMEIQDAPATYLFKLWPWFEANRIRIIWGGAVIVVAAGVISFYSWHRDQNEIAAGMALTQVMRSIPRNATASQQADFYLKIATDYQGTTGGQRALLQGAAILYAAGRYADAQAQFQKFLDTYPASFFAAQAALGVATSLDAQGQALWPPAFTSGSSIPMPTRWRWTPPDSRWRKLTNIKANFPQRQIFTKPRALQSRWLAWFGSQDALDGIESEAAIGFAFNRPGGSIQANPLSLEAHPDWGPE